MKDIIIVALIIVIVLICFLNYYIFQDPFYFLRFKTNIENISIDSDKDEDGILDNDDIVEGARKEIENKTTYKSGYYLGGFPPENEGVCTDVVWRAFKNAGYDLKSYMDEDIIENIEDYPRVENKPDPNIDFRRVKNQYVFLKKYSNSLTTKVIPHDIDNLKQWQKGDIVVLKKPDHIAVISDKRRKDGVPYVIHNANTYPKEENLLI